VAVQLILGKQAASLGLGACHVGAEGAGYGFLCGHAAESLPAPTRQLNKKGANGENKIDEKTCQPFQPYAL
jgi:hypothetical protein